MLRFIFLATILFNPRASARASDLNFSDACQPGNNVTISAVGDLLLHKALQQQAYNEDGGFQTLWKEASPIFEAVDVSYGNVEGPVAENIMCNGRPAPDSPQQLDPECRKSKTSVYTSYPRFNYHPSLVSDLVSSGFDIVSAANNHSMDRGPLGVEKTIDAFENQDLPYTGIRRAHQESAPWHTVTNVRGNSIAWLSVRIARTDSETLINRL